MFRETDAGLRALRKEIYSLAKFGAWNIHLDIYVFFCYFHNCFLIIVW
jgi:hypothetical protein